MSSTALRQLGRARRLDVGLAKRAERAKIADALIAKPVRVPWLLFTRTGS
jgi:hypothetical protein